MKTNMKIDIEKSIIYRFDDNTDISEAVLMLGEKGYFSDDKDFSDYIAGTLTGVVCWLEKTEYTFVGRNEKSSNACRYFIPENKVVFKKELRPYKTIAEFPKGIGSVLTYRSKSEPSVHILTCVGSTATQDNDLIFVCLGGLRFTPLDLLKHYEYLNATKDEWLPFGVEE